MLGVHLVPLLGGKKLDAISNGDIQRVKTRLASKAPKAVNNVLTFLNVVLRKPVEWNVLERMPCVIR